MTIGRKLELFRVLQSTIRTMAVQSVVETKEDYIELNIDQLKRGKRSDGTQIGTYFSPSYALDKFEKNPLAGLGNVDLILTGDFTNALDIAARGTSFEEFSHDEKFSMLKQRYGNNILGLTAENLYEFYRKESFLPNLMPKVRKLING